MVFVRTYLYLYIILFSDYTVCTNGYKLYYVYIYFMKLYIYNCGKLRPE